MNKKIEIIPSEGACESPSIKPSIPGFKKFSHRALVSEIFLDEFYNDCLWYEKAMLAMIKAKALTLDIPTLNCVFITIRAMYSRLDDIDVSEILHILDQFSRRLGTINIENNSITEVALVSALVGMKVSSDLSVWNEDLVNFYNKESRRLGVAGSISYKRMCELEYQHLLHLQYVTGFGMDSKRELRLHDVLNFVDSQTLLVIEKELEKLKNFDSYPYIGSSVQKALYRQFSDRRIGFFKGCKESKADDAIEPEIDAMSRALHRSK